MFGMSRPKWLDDQAEEARRREAMNHAMVVWAGNGPVDEATIIATAKAIEAYLKGRG